VWCGVVRAGQCERKPEMVTLVFFIFIFLLVWRSRQFSTSVLIKTLGHNVKNLPGESFQNSKPEKFPVETLVLVLVSVLSLKSVETPHAHLSLVLVSNLGMLRQFLGIGL
jgi:hypothetical protein